MAKTTSKPHADEAGFITAKTNHRTQQDNVLYDAKDSGFDETEGRWVVFCVAHGSVAQETNQKRARKLLSTPETWCGHCRSLAEPQPPVSTARPVPFALKTPQDQERELRFAAMMVRDNPEKIALFERVYGVKPEGYWAETTDVLIRR